MKRIFLFVLIFFAVGGFFTSPLSFAQFTDDLEKERLQLEKERRIYDETYQNLQQQINSLTTTLSQLQSSGVDDDKLKDLEEQLEELFDDLSDLEKTERDLIEREEIFKKNNVPQNTSAETTNLESESLPPWFKSNAKWWKEGLISDGDIINALESLIIQDVIPLEKFVKESSGLEHVAGTPKGGDFVIPTYQKDVFGFWSDGLVSDDEIVNSIGHLMSQGIINSAKIQGEIAERQVKFDKKMAEIDSALDSESKVRDNLEEEYKFTTIENSDGSKTLKFDDGTYTIFYADGSRVTHYPQGFDFDEKDNGRVGFLVGPNGIGGLSSMYVGEHGPVTTISKLVTEADGSRSIYDFKDYDSYENSNLFADATSKGLVIHSVIPDLSYDDEPVSTGGMEQLIQVTVLTIDTIQYPISQFTMWKWTGECDDAWHYHTPTTQAISTDGETGIVDPDQENCGFGKVGEVFVGTWFMSQAEIDKFREKTDSDPLTNEAMMGGSDDGNNLVDVNPGPATIEESDDKPYTSSKSKILTDFDDSDGDGIADEIDDSPIVSTTFGSLGTGLPGEILDLGGLEVRIIGSDEFGALTIEITDDGTMFTDYDEGETPFAIIQVLGIEFEMEPGIYEFSFG